MRWIAVLVASVLLHLIAFDWIDGSLTLPAWHTAPDQVVIAELRPASVPAPSPPAMPAEPVSPPKPKPARRTAPAVATPAPAQHAAPSSAPEVLAGEAVPGTSMEAPAEVVAAAPVQQPASAPPTTPTLPAEASKPEASTASQYKFSAPPSAELQYEVEAKREGQSWHGTGAFRWDATDADYSVTAEASIRLIFKITVLNSRSEGKLKEFGIAPVLYSEKPLRKSLTSTHFQHDNHKITFSASEASYPYLGGEQDRASVLFQLAGIGLASPETYTPGAQLNIVVAGSRDAEPWQIQVLGEEDLELPAGKLHAWHVVRPRRTGSYDANIDIWLAPEQHWYPVRLRYTYVNADYLDMSLSDIAQASH